MKQSKSAAKIQKKSNTFKRSDLRLIQGSLADHSKKFIGIGKRFDDIDRRLDAMDLRFAGIDRRFDRLEDQVRRQGADIIGQNEKILAALDGITSFLPQKSIVVGHEARIQSLEQNMVVVNAALKNRN